MLQSRREILAENASLRARLDDAEEALRAIRNGEVDALVLPGPNGQEVYTLKTADHAYRVLVEEMQEGAVVVADEGTMAYANMRVAQMLKRSLEQVIGLNFLDCFDPTDQPPVEHLLHQARGSRARVECRVRASDGTLVPVYLSASKFNLEDRPALCIVITDLSDQKRAEEVAAANLAKDRFLAMLSHELRTPLNPVMATIHLLEMETSLPAEFRDSVAMIRRNVELEVRLIDDLLDLTKVRQGKVELKYESVDVHAVIKAALEINANEITNKQIDVSLKLWATHHRVWADPARLQQILWNLLKNAVKFTPQSGRIEIASSNVIGKINIEVRDSGIGIEPAALPKLFDAFEQTDPTITRRFGGLGLGLTISKALAEMHSGKLAASSDGLGKGAAFTLELPTIADGEHVAAPRLSLDASGKRCCRILLVEDHLDTVRAMVRLLQRMGHTVTTAGTVQEGISIAATGNFDLLISDLGLPDGSGIEIMQHLRAHPTNNPIAGIALSGFGQDEDISRSKQAGFAAHLIKPLNVNALQDAIAKVMA